MKTYTLSVMNPQLYSLLMTRVWLQGKIPLLSEPHNLCHLGQTQPGGRGSNSQILIVRDLSIRSRSFWGWLCACTNSTQKPHQAMQNCSSMDVTLLIASHHPSRLYHVPYAQWLQPPLPHRKRQRQTSGSPPLSMGEKLFGVEMPLLVVPYCQDSPSKPERSHVLRLL